MRFFIFSLIFTLIFFSCENTENAIGNTGLRPEAEGHLRTGSFTEAINSQLTAPGGDCAPNAQIISTLQNQPPPEERPKATHSENERRQICERRAQWAKANGVNTLTVSFEGLGSFNAGYTNRFYKYYDDLWKGGNPRAPGGIGSHVGRNLIAPHLKNDYRKSDFLLFSERGGSKTVQGCIGVYKRVIGENFKLNILGLSFGAGEALALSEKLENDKEFGPDGIKVDNLMTMDLRGSQRVGDVGPRLRMNGNFQTPSNVTRHMNFGRFNAVEIAYISPTLGYPGYRSAPSGRPGTQTTNHLMPTMSGHASQIKSEVIQNYYGNLIN